jgi:hypothetical protein
LRRAIHPYLTQKISQQFEPLTYSKTRIEKLKDEYCQEQKLVAARLSHNVKFYVKDEEKVEWNSNSLSDFDRNDEK